VNTQAAEARPRNLSPSGRYPGAVVAGQVLRRAARSGSGWGLVFGGYVAVQTLAYTSGYTTQAARDQFARAYSSNVGINALIGPARNLNTVAGYASWRLLGILSILGAVWGLLTATRLMRGEEDAGRAELLLAGQTTRRRAAAQAMAGLGGGLIVLFTLTATGTILTGHSARVGFSAGQSLYLSVTLVAGAATFLAVGALTSQLATTRRRAAATAGAVFGIAYALRMVADSDPALHWLVWLSPLGWIEESRPLTHPRPAALLPVLALLAILAAATVYLAGGRDLGAATLPDTDSSAPHMTLLSNPTGMAVRLIRPVALGWLFAVAAFAVLLGSVAEASTNDAAGSTGVQRALSRLGGHGSLVELYLGLTFLLLALLLGLVAAGQVTAIRAEESEGRLENLVVRPLSRTSWFAGRLGLAAFLIVLAALVAGIGSWAGAASQHSGVGFASLILAGLNIAAPPLFLLGLGALLIGAWPQRTAVVVYGYLAWSFLIEFLGAVVHASHWLLDTSVFFHMAPAPATSPDWASATALTVLGLAGTIIGGILFTRRDVIGS
jgi:ABC-2 type transport system permease protein